MSQRSPSQEADPLELVRLFHTLGPAYIRWSSQHVPTQGLTPARLRVLAYLEEHGDSPMRAIKEALQTTATNVTGLVDGLEREGLVERRGHPEDRRVSLVALTAKGRQERAGSWEAYERKVAQVFERMEPRARAQLAAGVRSLLDVLATLERGV